MQKINHQTLCSDLLVEVLNRLDIKVVFCITGAGNLAIVDALVRDANIEIVYSHHEQAAVMEAQGYSRVTVKIGVALVTTGCGTSNTLTCVLIAHLDSIPIMLIS
jgi:acetolactate synthase-1/2/3 large subunit